MGLTVSLTADRRSAAVYARFTGGDPAYSNRRRLHLEATGAGPTLSSDIDSAETSGPDSTFIGPISGLLPGRSYQWTAVVLYWDGSAWQDSSYTASGTFTLPGVLLWVWDGTAWVKSLLRGFSDNWEHADLRTYDTFWKG